MIPYPPYTLAGCLRRFPEDAAAHKRIMLLREVVENRQTRAELSATYGLSQARISQLYHRWKNGGLVALLTSPNKHNGVVPREPELRRLLQLLKTTTPLQIGMSAIGRAWAGQIGDPALRTLWIRQQIEDGISAIDKTIEAQHGIAHLLERHFLGDEKVRSIASMAALSHSRLYALIQHGVGDLHRYLRTKVTPAVVTRPWSVHLPSQGCIGRTFELESIQAFLSTERAVRLVGLPGMGKSTIAATIATQWERAGWNVYWVRPDAVVASLDHMLEALCNNAAIFGSVEQRIDPARPVAERIRYLAQTMNTLPTLCIFDDVHVFDQCIGWEDVLKQLFHQVPTLHLLLVGRACSVNLGQHLHLEGLGYTDAVTLRQQVSIEINQDIWNTLFRWSGGNPKILCLIQANTDAAIEAVADLHTFLETLLHQLRPQERELLLWLSLWDGPMHYEHQFVSYIPASINALKSLIDHHYVTLHDAYLLVHDLIREYLRMRVPTAEWETIRARVRTYVHSSGDWLLGYRCAGIVSDVNEQQIFSQYIAKQADMKGDVGNAFYWWRIHRQLSEAVDAQRAAAHARIVEADLLLHLARPREALDVVDTLSVSADIHTRWWRALLMVEAYRLLGDSTLMVATLTDPQLTDPPETIQVHDRWRLSLQRVLVQIRLGRLDVAWQAHQRLPPPPSLTPVRFLQEYTQAGALLAIEHNDYEQFRKLRQRYKRYVRGRSYTYSSCAAQIEWAQGLYAQEQFVAARDILKKVHPLLERSWTSLRWRASVFRAAIEYDLGNARAAREAWKEAHHTMDELGVASFAGFTALIGAIIAIGIGDLDDGSKHLAQAHAYYSESRNLSQLGVVAYQEAIIALHRGQTDTAHLHLRQALSIIHGCRLNRFLLHFRLAWSDCQLQKSAPAQAYRSAGRTVQAARQQGLHMLHAKALTAQAEALLHLNQFAYAMALTDQAVNLIRDYPLGVQGGPQIWTVRAWTLDANKYEQLAQNAWDQASKHVAAQIHLFPDTCDSQILLALPYYCDIMQSVSHINSPRKLPRVPRSTKLALTQQV